MNRKKELSYKFSIVFLFTILVIMTFITVPVFADETKYTVTWDMNGGKINGEDSYTETLGSDDLLIPPSDRRKAYKVLIEPPANKLLRGWSTNRAEKGIVKFTYHDIGDGRYWEGHNYPLNEDRTYYAIWSDPVSITFNAGSGGRLYELVPYRRKTETGYELGNEKAYCDSITKEYAKGIEIFNYPLIEASNGKAFRGWSTTTDERGLIPWLYHVKGYKEFRCTARDNQTLTAIFSDKIIVTWDMGEGTLFRDGEKKKVEQEYAKGDTLNDSLFWHFRLEGPSGRKLLGFSTDGTEKGIINLNKIWVEEDWYCYYSPAYPVLENMTLTAVWEQDPTTKLAKARDDAIKKVNAVDLKIYVEADQEIVKNAKTAALNTIDTAKTEDEVTKAVAAFNNTIKGCTTKAVTNNTGTGNTTTPAPSGGGGGSLLQVTDPTPSETELMTDLTSAPVETPPSTTQDVFTGISETIETSADGTAVVTSVADNGGKTLRVTGAVNQNGTNYTVSSFATKSFSNVDVKNIIIDLKASGNTQTVTFMPRTFKGSGANRLTLRLSSSTQVKFSSGALSGSKIKKVVVSGLNKKEFKKVQKKLMKSGYKGKIVKK